MPSRRSSVKSSSTVKRYAKGKHNVCEIEKHLVD
jgi:hypothetical protein